MGYLYRTDFSLVKRLVGYNVPEKTELPLDRPLGSNLDYLTLPSELKISIFAEGLKDPRVIVFDPAGRMLVSETKEGRVVALNDKNKDGKVDEITTVLENLRSPHGLAFYTDKYKKLFLYVAETNQVMRYDYDVSLGRVLEATKKNIANLPPDGQHFTRTIAFGKDFRSKPLLPEDLRGSVYSDIKLYISVGSSCDACEESTWKRAAILEADPEGTYTAEFAGGLRNSVFFTFHPETQEMWATEMGRDNLGDDLPPDEVNIIRVASSEQKYGARRFGWPFCYGNKIRDKKFKPPKFERIDIPQDCSQTEAPIIEIPAHSAPLGLAFITSDRWPKEWKNDLLVAYHGSWNRSEPTGYKIVKFDVDKNGKLSGTADFVTGWLDKNKIFGRPVDLKFGPDGALYVSDDSAGLIYKIEPK